MLGGRGWDSVVRNEACRLPGKDTPDLLCLALPTSMPGLPASSTLQRERTLIPPRTVAPLSPQPSAMRHLPALVAFFAISLGPTGAAPSAAGQDTEALEALMVEVNDLMLRLPLRYHIQAYESLARSREPEAIGSSPADTKPDLPKDQERYLMASSLAAIGKKGKDGLAQALADWRRTPTAPRTRGCGGTRSRWRSG